MPAPLILASGSEIRRDLLQNAGLDFRVEAARLDEESIRRSLVSEDVSPRNMADALAEAKALKVSGRNPEAFVIGADQILEFNARALGKPETREEAFLQLSGLSGQAHKLHSAAVITEAGQAVWRQISTATLTMRPLSPDFIQSYLDRNWRSVSESVGSYKIEEEGPRLFSNISGSHFAILGLPLLELLSYLTIRGYLDT